MEEIWTPDTVLTHLAHPPEPYTSSPIPFFHLLERLKTTRREGWRQVKIPRGESISDHMYRMAIMVMSAPPSLASVLDIPRCISMALVHDMAECLVGDITPRNIDIEKTEKVRRELSAMQYIVDTLLGRVPGGSGIGGAIMELFQEYEENRTLEAKFVHDVDKVEMLCQILEYERRHKRRLDEFYHVVGEILEPVPDPGEVPLEDLELLEVSGKAVRNSTILDVRSHWLSP
ncbi:HD domain-containing protein [Aspergillus tanneri]|uniref:5'-deoxynucleotidase n=1 Tax=Aspergillus tanneri TaxID=1220188 RepID=A0A5M9MSN2_9EURO|nr:uncharacterized protein ATNIH1004_004289 [Aspergillus tanneri]KAA8648404.1 hypothetical protein ATNIH1004_004289 [Aspergillus tanneri]